MSDFGSYEPQREMHFPSILVGSAIGYGITKLASVAPGIVERWPLLFEPIWNILPIGVIGAFLGALVAAFMAPVDRIRGSADGAGVAVGIGVTLTMLPDWPGILKLFLLTIAYGFIGFVSGSIINGIRAGERSKEDESSNT